MRLKRWGNWWKKSNATNGALVSGTYNLGQNKWNIWTTPPPDFNDAKMARFCSFAPSSLLWGGWGLIVPFYSVQDCRYQSWWCSALSWIAAFQDNSERAQSVEEKEEPVEERKIYFAPLNRLFSAHLTFPSHHAVCHAPFKIAWQFSPMRLLRFLDLKLSLISWIKAVRLSLFKFTFFWTGIKYFKFSPLFLSTVYTSRKVQPNYNRGSTLSSNVVTNNFCFLSQVVGSMPLKVMVAEPKFRKGWGKKTAMWLSRLFIHNTVFRNKRQLPKETGVVSFAQPVKP